MAMKCMHAMEFIMVQFQEPLLLFDVYLLP